MPTYGFDESGVRRIVKSVRQIENASQQSPQPFNPMVSSGTSETWIECKNNAGEEIPAHSVVFVTTDATVGDRKVNNAIKPSTTFYPLHGFTPGLPVASAQPVGVVMENALVRYDTGTPAPGEGWGIKPGQYTLSKGYPGARCIRIVDSTKKIMLAEFLPITTLLGKSSASISANSSPDSTKWDIYVGTAGSEADSTFDAPTAYCRVAIASGKFVQVFWRNNGWEMTPLEC